MEADLPGTIQVDLSDPAESELARWVALSRHLVTPDQPPTGHTEVNATLGPLTILLAEDNPINQKVAIRLLQGLGHQVSLAEDGIQPVTKGLADPFDLIFMDIQMPHLDGLQASQQLPARGYCKAIAALTALAGSEDEPACQLVHLATFGNRAFPATASSSPPKVTGCAGQLAGGAGQTECPPFRALKG